MQLNTIVQSEALALMASLPDQSVDAIITDLPYGTTNCAWDTVIPFEPMWAAVRRILKPKGAFVTTASQPFSSTLIMSNIDWFKYEFIWVKSKSTGFLNAKNKPLKAHENILVFSPGTTVHANQGTRHMIYNPQFKPGKAWTRIHVKTNIGGAVGHAPTKANFSFVGTKQANDKRYPNSVLFFPANNYKSLHPTQKPVPLYEYLIKTYTNPGGIVLDFVCGSGTTALAAVRTGRNFICGDSSAHYVEIANRRLRETDGFIDKPVAPGLVQKSLFV